MRQHALKKTAFDAGVWEKESRRRLRRGKAWILVSNALAFMLAMAVVVFAL